MTDSIDRIWEEIDRGREKPEVLGFPAPDLAGLRGPEIPPYIIKGMRKAIVEFDLLEPGDRVLVGFSGGKDSTLLMHALSRLTRHIPWPVELAAMHIDLGFRSGEEADYGALAASAAAAGLELKVQRQDLSDDILHNQEQNPCSRCSYWRRALIHNYARRHGYNKVAFAHHYDDAVETWLMGLLYSGQLGTFMPKTYLDRTEVTVIRPFAYIRERDIIGAANKMGLEAIASPCPLDGYTQRTRVKELIRDLSKENPLVFDHLASGMRQGKRQHLWPAPLERKELRRKNLAFWRHVDGDVRPREQ
ncbi:MAG: tRNA 2-thiocytidine biosynthesis TtcA family protein [Clostridiales bacterium]|nr:tRNA 2-thiocytidine biosynthesis TtcA family protein [Clostridiales bacterium]